jgi:DNA mismatch repair ATPase MutL
MPTDAVDVNVSPDKREIFLHNELDLVEALRVSWCGFDRADEAP